MVSQLPPAIEKTDVPVEEVIVLHSCGSFEQLMPNATSGKLKCERPRGFTFEAGTGEQFLHVCKRHRRNSEDRK